VACATLVGLVGLAVLVDALRRPAVQVVTVVVVDMVASGRIVAERDPMCAYELLAAERARIVALARGAGGAHRRDVENTGDGAIVRFNSPDRALEFCRAVMAPRADGPRYRLGASLGPIAVGPDGVVGMAVWEAVSLCASASPGSALIAGSVRGGLGAERAAGLAPHAPVEVKHIRTIGVHLLIPGDKAPAAPAVPPASCEGGRRRARRAAARNRGGRDASR
jgi:class 3 adenylate cyclase